MAYNKNAAANPCRIVDINKNKKEREYNSKENNSFLSGTMFIVLLEINNKEIDATIN